MTARQMALRLASALDNKKGLEVRVLDLRGVCGFADYFVLATGTSARHVRTLAEAAIDVALQSGAKPRALPSAKAASTRMDACSRVSVTQKSPKLSRIAYCTILATLSLRMEYVF